MFGFTLPAFFKDAQEFVLEPAATEQEPLPGKEQAVQKLLECHPGRRVENPPRRIRCVVQAIADTSLHRSRMFVVSRDLFEMDVVSIQSRFPKKEKLIFQNSLLRRESSRCQGPCASSPPEGDLRAALWSPLQPCEGLGAVSSELRQAAEEAEEEVAVAEESALEPVGEFLGVGSASWHRQRSFLVDLDPLF